MLRVLGAVPVLGFLGWNLCAGVYLPSQYGMFSREKPVWSDVGLSKAQAIMAVEEKLAAYRPGSPCSRIQVQQAQAALAEVDEDKLAAKVRYRLWLHRQMLKAYEKRQGDMIGRIRADYAHTKAVAPFDCDEPNGALAIIRAG